MAPEYGGGREYDLEAEFMDELGPLPKYHAGPQASGTAADMPVITYAGLQKACWGIDLKGEALLGAEEGLPWASPGITGACRDSSYATTGDHLPCGAKCGAGIGPLQHQGCFLGYIAL